MNHVSATFDNNELRVPLFHRRYGFSSHLYERQVIGVAIKVTAGSEVDGISPYRGGCWCLEQVGEGNEAIFWWRLEADDRRFLFVSEGQQESFIIDADMLSMVVSLFAVNMLAWHYDNTGDKSLSELYSNTYQALEGHFMGRMGNDEERISLLFRLID